MPDLKKCHCGKDAEFVKESDGYGRVMCSGNRQFLPPKERCYMKTTAAPGNRSIESWNNRPLEVALPSASDNTHITKFSKTVEQVIEEVRGELESPNFRWTFIVREVYDILERSHNTERLKCSG